jgi:hypothetical protein
MNTTNTEQQMEQKLTAAPQLTISDLAGVIQLIDIVSRRGAFEGSELSAVGVLRSKFVEFVQSKTPKPLAGEAEGENKDPNITQFPGSST